MFNFLPEVGDLASVKTETPIANSNGAADNTLLSSLLRREFGARGTFFSVTAEDYLEERRRKRLVSKRGEQVYFVGFCWANFLKIYDF